jgi:tetratricopeptide (TPR) repeat protein
MSELRHLFDLACDLPPAQRETALREAGADAAMIREVLDLLDADAATRTRSRSGVSAMIAEFGTTELHAGDLLGVWRLLREIGHGGMGAVYLAERADGHFDQQAAVKLIRGIADEVAALRFAQERQTLANLQHPQIARLLDGGETPGGAPYLVMEYIEGIPLDAWCVEAKPGLDERLRIFVSICKTLQFAHQRLIVHCDLKPSNVLVRADGVPVLLDFGIARALDRAEADAVERSYLTPRYASPEQVRGEAPTVASDVYALGALLYFLITDAAPPPFDAEHPAALPAPSAAATTVPWRARLKGDIDAIVVRACALDPARRYQSALALADDIERIAVHRPVLARKPTPAYIGARLLRRRWPAFAVGALILALVAGFTWRTVLAEREARTQAAVSERVSDFLVSLFQASDSNLNANRRHDLTARAVLDAGAARIDKELADEPRIRARLLEAVGNAYRHMDVSEPAAKALRTAADLNLGPAVDQPRDAARCLEELVNTRANGDFPSDETERLARQSLELRERYEPAGSQTVANSWMVLSLALVDSGKLAEAQAAAEKTLAMLEHLDKPERMDAALNNLGMILSRRGDNAAAIGYYQRRMDLDASEGNTHSEGHAGAMNNYAHALERAGQLDRSIPMQRQVLAIIEDIDGAESDMAAYSSTGLCRMLVEAGSYDEALQRLDATARLRAKLNGPDSAEYFNVLGIIANAQSDRGEPAAALETARRVLDFRKSHFTTDDPRVSRTEVAVASSLLDLHQTGEEAQSLLDHAIASGRKHGEFADFMPDALVEKARLLFLRGGPEAEDATRLLVDVHEHGKGMSARTLANAASLAADIAAKSGDTAVSVQHAGEAWKVFNDQFGATHPQTARYGLVWARGLRAIGETAKAEALEKELRPVFEAAFPADSIFRRE